MPIQRPGRLPLPLSSSLNIPPNSLTSIIARPQTAKFYPERLLIKEAHHWWIAKILVGNQAEALAQNLPGAIFAPAAPGRFPACGELEIPPGGDLIVEVKYTGLKETGIPFEACVFGSDDRPLPVSSTPRRREKKITTAGDGMIVKQSVQLFTDPMKYDTWPCRLVIKNASDWSVNDIRVGEVSIFAQSGDVPGGMFSEDVESAICLGRLAAGDTFSVVATYVGAATGAAFIYDLYGTLDETEARDLPIGTILPMSSGVNCASGQWMQITGRCQPPGPRHRGISSHQGFLAERIVVENAADWIFNDIKVGRTSQFAQSREVPGLAFSPETLRNAVSFDAARAGIDVVIVTTHVGPLEVGAPLSCGIWGCIVDLTGDSPSPHHGRILTVRDFYKSNP